MYVYKTLNKPELRHTLKNSINMTDVNVIDTIVENDTCPNSINSPNLAPNASNATSNIIKKVEMNVDAHLYYPQDIKRIKKENRNILPNAISSYAWRDVINTKEAKDKAKTDAIINCRREATNSRKSI